MKVICIDDSNNGIKELTYGKEYEILYFYYQFNQQDDIRQKQVRIINDIGIRNDYYLSRFVTTKEFRNIKLNEIGI